MAQEIKLLSFQFKKISGEKNPDYSGKLDVKSNIDIKSIEKFRPEISREDTVKVDCNFTLDYGGLGKVEISGILFLLLDSKTQKDLLNGWKDKKIPSDLNVAILNVILQKASLKALEIENELGLPLHIQLPKLQSSEEKK